MPGHPSHNENVESERRQLFGTAQATLNGQLDYLVGYPRLSALRHDVYVAGSDADFLTCVGIDSDTDALPLGAVRRHLSVVALVKRKPAIQSAEALVFNY